MVSATCISVFLVLLLGICEEVFSEENVDEANEDVTPKEGRLDWAGIGSNNANINIIGNNNGKHEVVPGGKCVRPCTGQTLTCYYEFIMEDYATMTDACGNCSTNTKECFRPQCISGDGYETAVNSVNRMMPGPPVHVCRGDTIVVDVENRFKGRATTVHWHGILQRGTPYMDGVPMVTQCEILEGNTFRYKFEVPLSGTYFWHAHSGFQRLDGAAGALVVREPQSDDPSGGLYDYDLPEHYIFIQDWMHELAANNFPGRRIRDINQLPRSFLINGKGRYVDRETGKSTTTPYHIYHVKPGRKYLFRLINAGALSCPQQIQIQNHRMLLVATDSNAIQPVYVDTLVSMSGERYDFVLETRNEPGSYWIQLKGVEQCTTDNLPNQLAILRYEGADLDQLSDPPDYHNNFHQGVVMNDLGVDCSDSHRGADALCLTDLKYAGKHSGLLGRKPDARLHLPIGFYAFQPGELNVPGEYNNYMKASVQFLPSASYMGRNISFSTPSAPLLTQPQDVEPKTICNTRNLPSGCVEDKICYCTHVESFRHNSVVEIVLINTFREANLSHPFHLHGYKFQVLAQGLTKAGEIALEEANNGSMYRRLDMPPFKDTVHVYSQGYAVIRFKADNPGYWLFHCHLQHHLLTGMQMVIHVEGNVPPPPKQFPHCGNFKPPI